MKENNKSQFSILFVDDEENARKYFDKGLKNYFSILTAANVEEAQKIIIQHHQNIAVVVTDQRMPGGNGVKLLKFLRENYPHIIRLLTTAYSDLSEAIEAVNSGEIFRYIQKPWDYNLLKTELHQAMELFELRFERNQMLREKIMVKRKMTKIERIKILLLMSNFFKFLNFSENSIKNFIQNFANKAQNQIIDQDWQSFDLGNQDIQETKLLLELTEKLQTTINYSDDFNLDRNLNCEEIKSLIEEKSKNNLPVKIAVKGQSQVKISMLAINIIIEKLLEILSSQQNSTFNIEETENGISLTAKTDKSQLLEQDNIFVANADKSSIKSYLNLLICYLLVGHHGGTVEVKSDEENLIISVKLPNDLEKFNFLSQSKSESVENIILGAMLN